MANADMLARRSKAKELVEKIKVGHGYMSQEELMAITPPSARANVIGSLQNKDDIIAASVMTLAQNLYTSDARFVFELLQNADDNQHSNTNESRFITFHVYSQKIIVEYNEDGFSPENLKAICTINQSTKKGAQGYIGNKGIGFKSVFMVASKVSIQSGDFSFYFEHRKGDAGMGMISPVWEEHDPTVSESVTRLTLFLHCSEDKTAFGAQHKLIRSQFRELQATFLLFPKNIRRINVKLFNESNDIQEDITHSVMDVAHDRTTILVKNSAPGRKVTTESQSYYVTKYLATGLKKSESREYSEKKKKISPTLNQILFLHFRSTLMLLPLCEHRKSLPFYHFNQQDFPYVASCGFGTVGADEMQFLIQADFVTEANRQDVVESSDRNLGLLNDIAKAYTKAILELCKHPLLAYQWMRYLPDPSDDRYTSFWKSLILDLKKLLESTPVLQSRDGGPLRRIATLKMYPKHSTDDDGNPLWDDIDPPCYISQKYAKKDLETLKSYGLVWYQMQAANNVAHILVEYGSEDPRTPRRSRAFETVNSMSYPPFGTSPSVSMSAIGRSSRAGIQHRSVLLPSQFLSEPDISAETAHDGTVSDSVTDTLTTEDTLYVSLLDNMINKSRTCSIPSIGPFNMSQMLQALTGSEVSSNDVSREAIQLRTASQRERDIKIGAAGELFVFELLSQMEPTSPDFGEANWQSTIRKYVTVHPKYINMEDWQGRETADIVYDDETSAFTDFLIDQNYLDSSRWQGRRPKYLIEVKSTTGNNELPFYMSKYQYRRMRKYYLPPQNVTSERGRIYLIARVFNVGLGTPGIRIYVDPKALRRTAGLMFTGESWSVIPGQQQS